MAGPAIQGRIILKRGKEASVQRMHPWIFSGAIHRTEGAPEEGSWVEVAAPSGQPMAWGHYQKATISVRVLHFGDRPPGEDFWDDKLRRSRVLRERAGLPAPHTNAYRLVNAEGDDLSGLIADVYDHVAVVQAHSAGMYRDRQVIADALKRVLGPGLTAVYHRSHFSGVQESGYLHGMAAVPHSVVEHDHHFLVDWEEGQKTGFFLDQRENRRRVCAYAENKKVLNTFCYTGGFSVYALKAGASLVHSVDVSDRAIASAKANLEKNSFDPSVHRCEAVDTFDFLASASEAYDLIILDPPAFAKHRDARHQAVKGYQRLNTEAMKVIAPGGVLATFSCSQVVDRQLFYDTLVSSALQAGRKVKVLERLGQPADHPVSIYHPEGEYLKGFILYVE
jgi:23S rRNA (cytosine1962-C5)-methyltransferase